MNTNLSAALRGLLEQAPTSEAIFAAVTFAEHADAVVKANSAILEGVRIVAMLLEKADIEKATQHAKMLAAIDLPMNRQLLAEFVCELEKRV